MSYTHISLILFLFFFSLNLSGWGFFSSSFLVAGKVYNYGCNLTPTTWAWNRNSKMEGTGKLGGDRTGENENVGGTVLNSSHSSTIERLYAWEKKLYEEVKVLDPVPWLGNLQWPDE